MVQRRRGARFLFEALQPAGIGGCVRGQNLDRDVTSKSRIPAAIDIAHASRAEQRVDLVWTEVDAGCQRHVEKSPGRCYGVARFGTRRRNSSNQLMTTLTCVAGGSGSLG